MCIELSSSKPTEGNDGANGAVHLPLVLSKVALQPCLLQFF